METYRNSVPNQELMFFQIVRAIIRRKQYSRGIFQTTIQKTDLIDDKIGQVWYTQTKIRILAYENRGMDFMKNLVPGSAFLTSLIGNSAFQVASQKPEVIQNITRAIQPLQFYDVSSTIRDMTSSIGGMTSVLAQFKQGHIFDTPEVLLNLQRQIDAAYNPIFDIAKQASAISANWSAMGQSAQLLSTLPMIESKTIEGISKALELYSSRIQHLASDISVEELTEYCEGEEITPDTVAETAEAICTETTEGKLTIPEHLDKIKKQTGILRFLYFLQSFLSYVNL